ncbi:hypothetical protein BCR44DRAFT_1462049 [Catenaria anguillulae PL171]|uniref:Uncharacterized protein n=1 Tax=Catenaria anguillulae PL171 TaxID=765915 RepID=A0A1Y2HK23_9FUNG|nr:hypothetical protein BCR44DRAFT_1462049 [Catenaria anguillulae PL171]
MCFLRNGTNLRNITSKQRAASASPTWLASKAATVRAADNRWSPTPTGIARLYEVQTHERMQTQGCWARFSAMQKRVSFVFLVIVHLLRHERLSLPTVGLAAV